MRVVSREQHVHVCPRRVHEQLVCLRNLCVCATCVSAQLVCLRPHKLLIDELPKGNSRRRAVRKPDLNLTYM